MRKNKSYRDPPPPQYGNNHARKHGVNSLLNSGPDKLTDPVKITRMAELRQLVKSEPGRQEIRAELTARMALLCDLGFSYLGQQVEVEAGADIWSLDVIKRLATYTAETRRLLDSFTELPVGFSAEQDRIKQVLEHDEIKHPRKGNRAGKDSSPDT